MSRAVDFFPCVNLPNVLLSALPSHTVYYFSGPAMKWRLPIKFGVLAVKSELAMIQ